ncbi:hypothetical protein JI721_06345 [Alicyclobacillus cycloheptanicus]|uniref:Preprotein translocase subunit YajC n=1 Tax=Alicyclobacillus cycloheptanicus TaxID=1457 RepID=A0ABT9XLV6_9BACL|nr:hypothetical protein [Alicyclobacillus cycloheptanicus]MDQ0191292.1 preprotein translocase subunit YajC [Alicyclobacillus cycloheptanicus]WDM02412.1 hypothetical protein JI721_06345 [Alicyclobacillus cycloheptanicus]
MMVTILQAIAWIVAIAGIIWCIVIQRRALNKIAFGRSMFISGMAVLTGLIVGQLPSIAATIISVCLIVIGLGMLVFMAVKSQQHLRKRARSTHSTDAGASETTGQ